MDLPTREENEDEAAYNSRIVTELLKRVSLAESELAKAESERHRQEKRATILEGQRALEGLINSSSSLSSGQLDIQIPPQVVVSSDTLNEAALAIKNYNSNKKPSTECSYSIRNPRSVHCLWRTLIMLAGKGALAQGSTGTRVVYEWGIPHPVAGRTCRLDYTLIPAALRHLNWIHYRGGIELKKSPPKGAMSNTLSAEGRPQAISHAAMCVYSRWKAADWAKPTQGGHRAFCIYADSRQLGLARVTLGTDCVVSVDIFGPVALPGWEDTKDSTALRLLRHVLISNPEDMPELLSLPPAHYHEAPLRGIAETSGTGEAEAEWEMGEFLGSGGFGFVCASGDDESGGRHRGESATAGRYGELTVVKTSILAENFDKLKCERMILQTIHDELAGDPGLLVGIPKCIEALTDADGNTTALRLCPRGVSISKYFSTVDMTPELLTQVVRALGPAMVHALKAAHSVHVYHCDVRLPNLLLVPPAGVMASIAACRGDPLAEPDCIASICPAVCRFVLIDWGQAKHPPTTRKTLARDDLTMLVEVLMDPVNLTAVSDIGERKGSPVDSTAERLSATAGKEGPPAPNLAITFRRNLVKCAQDMNYDELSELLSTITFE